MQLPSDIWLRRMTFDAAQSDVWRRLLSDEERARYAAFPIEKRKREFLLGRVALRTLLAERLDQNPETIPLHVTEAGEVTVATAPYHVSIAHSRDRAVAAVSPRRVGVDLEHVRTCPPAVVDFALRPEEQDELARLPMSHDAAFILCWTLKEAALKAMGTGFARSPKKVRIDIDPAAQVATAMAWDGSGWTVVYEPVDDYFLSVAYPAA